jgi:hypothetical protein
VKVFAFLTGGASQTHDGIKEKGMRHWTRAALATLLAAGAATAAFAATTATDTVGTAYTSSSEVLMLGIAGANQAVLNVGTVMDQTEAGARAEAQPTFAGSDSGHLQYTTHGYSTYFKILVESPTVNYVDGSVKVRGMRDGEGGSSFSILGVVDDRLYAIGHSPVQFIYNIDGSDSWTGTRPRDGILVQYFAYVRDLGVSNIEVVYTIMAQ